MKIALTLAALVITAAPLLAEPGGCVGIVAGSNQKNDGAFASAFSATEIVDIDLSVIMNPGMAKQLSRDHILELRIFNPRGDLYQSTSVPVTADPTRAGEAVVPGYPRPMKKKVLSEVRYNNAKHYRATVRLPVAGTIITRNSLYGRWTSEAVLDGEVLKCSKPAEFVIGP
ncbi:MAG: hypothetical protein ACYC7A_03385 [Thermoanaerobaculia bacterium]